MRFYFNVGDPLRRCMITHNHNNRESGGGETEMTRQIDTVTEKEREMQMVLQ